MSRRTLIIILALVAVGAVAFMATRRNDATGETAINHAIESVDSRIDQGQAEAEALANENAADANFNAAETNAENGNLIDAAGNAIDGAGNSIQQGSNEAQAEGAAAEANANEDAARSAVTGQ